MRKEVTDGKGGTKSKTSHSIYYVEWKEEPVQSRDGSKETIPVTDLEQGSAAYCIPWM